MGITGERKSDRAKLKNWNTYREEEGNLSEEVGQVGYMEP